jgi:hypothetical protein
MSNTATKALEPIGTPGGVSRHDQKRVTLVWILLFASGLSYSRETGLASMVPLRFEQLVTALALLAAFLLALNYNRRIRLAGSWPVWLYAVVPVIALFAPLAGAGGLGTLFRAVRFMFALLIMALLAPAWRKDPWVLANAHARALRLAIAAALLSLCIGMGWDGEGRLIAQMPALRAPQVGQFGALLVGITAVQAITRSPRLPRAPLWILFGLAALVLSQTRTATVALLVAFAITLLFLLVSHSRARRVFLTVVLVGPLVFVLMQPAIKAWFERDQSEELLTTLTGRTQAWALVYSFPRTGFQELFGIGYGDKSIFGLPIDNGYLAAYQETGKVGLVAVCAIMVILLLKALSYPKTSNRALAIFLITYVAVASYTETGIGDMSAYVLHLVLAGAMVTPVVVAAARPAATSGGSPPPSLPAGPPPAPGTALERIGLRRRTTPR